MQAVSLSKKGLEVILNEINKVSKVKIDSINHSFREQLNSTIDNTESEPTYHYEVSSNDTINGAPHVIDLDGVEFFNWVNE